ncbi:MAG: FKBP-type peptidyl-prolyl cis-trans isomerase [Candidatus Poribacteria bacterium]|nr:FKBP-type peptidyl-prolyl cis-trans isomerase [Candidatus Poribacteria bacterium]
MLFFWDSEKRAERNKRKGEAFLAANQQKEGVVTLPSGLQYRVIQEGNGETPRPHDTVVVQYRGTLINGKEFESSNRRRGPSRYRVDRLIPDWTEALQLMKVGAKWQLFIPPHLAYGPTGTKRKIGPNATLIYEIELLAIQ